MNFEVSTPWLHGFGVFAQAALALLGSTLEGGMGGMVGMVNGRVSDS